MIRNEYPGKLSTIGNRKDYPERKSLFITIFFSKGFHETGRDSLYDNYFLLYDRYAYMYIGTSEEEIVKMIGTRRDI